MIQPIYWRIDSNNVGGTTTGNVWSFTTVAASGAPIIFDANSSASATTAGTTISWSHTVGTGSNRILLVAFSGRDGNPTDGDPVDLVVSSVTYGSANLSLVSGSEQGFAQNGIAVRTELWYLLNPASGTDTITITCTGTNNFRVGGAVSLENVKQQAAEAVATNTKFQSSGENMSISTNITTQTDGAWVIDAVALAVGNGSWSTTTSGMDDQWTRVPHNKYSGAGSTKSVALAGSTTMSWLFTTPGTGSKRLTHSLAAFEPASSGSGSPPGQATSPSPADAATDVSVTTDLSWTADANATSHDVYFGTTTPGVFQGNQAATTFDTGTMDNDTTYYWRIDEKNAIGTTTGSVWSFTTIVAAPDQASGPDPNDGDTLLSLDADLYWDAAARAENYDVYFGTDSTPDATELQGNQAATSYDPNTMDANITYYWRIDSNNVAGMTTGNVWSFTAMPLPGQASSPNPADGATDVNLTADLSWTAGTNAATYDVYLGTDSTPDSGELLGNTSATNYDAGVMTASTTYYWLIDSKNDSGTTTGTVWSFTTVTPEPAPDVNSPAGLYKLNESSGTTAADDSGNGNNGTLVVLDANSWVAGFGGNGLEFTATAGEALELPTDAMDASRGTVSLWAYADNLNSTQFLFGHATQPWDNRIQLYCNSDGKLDLGLGDSTSVATDIATITTDEWHHIALTWDGINYVVYVDGNNDANGTYTGLSTLETYADVGNNGNSADRSDPFDGVIDEVRIYDRVMDVNQIAVLADPNFYVSSASNPDPCDSATNVSVSIDLSWTAGIDANSHDLYLGTSYSSVADANNSSSEFMGNLSVTSYSPANDLDYNTTYYWAVDELDTNDVVIAYGDIWSFTTEQDPNIGGGAITFDANSSASSTAVTTSISWSHTVGTGSNRILLVAFSGRDGDPTGGDPCDLVVSDVNYGGTSLTLVSGSAQGYDKSGIAVRTELWYLLNPASGTDTITITCAGTNNYRVGGAVSLENVKQQAAEAVATNTKYQSSGENMSISTNITTQTDGAWVFDAVALAVGNGSWSTTTSGMDDQWTRVPHNKYSGAGSTKSVASAGSTTMSWLFTTPGTGSKRLTHSLAAFEPASGGGGQPPAAASGPSPSDGATNVSATADLSWTAGSGATGHDVYFGTDSTPDSTEFQGNQASTTFDPGTMSNNTAYYWRIDEVNANGTTTGSVWSFTTIVAGPGQVSNPSPSDGAFDVSATADLSWSAGSGADNYDVYLGTDSTPDSGELKGNQTALSYDPGTMTNNTTYYWRIDSNNTAGITTGPVWSFTTIATAPSAASNPNPADGATAVPTSADLSWSATGADNFDVYFGTTSPGTFKGNQAAQIFDPGTLTAATTYYWRIDSNNVAGMTTGSVWSFTTMSGGALGNWFHRDIGDVNAPGGLDITGDVFTVDGSGADIVGTTDEFHYAYQPLQGSGTITARVISVENTNSWAKAGVMIRETLNPDSAFAFMHMRPAGSAFLYRNATGANANQTRNDSPVPPYWVRVVRSGSVFSGYVSADANNWTQVGSDVNITMAEHIYLGLAVTSHDDGVVCTATFDNVETPEPNDPNLIGWWTFNESSGSIASDMTSYGNDGNLIDMDANDWVTGLFANGLEFDGFNDVVQVSTNDMDVNAGTISMWVCPNSFTAKDFLFGHTSQPAFANRIQLYCQSDGYLDLGMGSNDAVATQIKELEAGKWYHIALTWDGSNYNVYVNSINESSGSYSGLATLNTYADIGNTGSRSDSNEAFYGVIDEVRLFNRTLDVNDIDVLYAMGPDAGKARNPYPEDGAVNVGNDVILSWVAGDYAADVGGHDVYFGTNFSDVNAGTGGTSMGLVSSTIFDPCTLTYGQTYYWCVDEVNDGNVWYGDVWSFTVIDPTFKATAPIPFNGAQYIDPNANLSWNAGDWADSHDVYFGTDSTPDAGEFQGNQAAVTFEPGTMDANTIYYWRIDEVNSPDTWTGDVWSFKTGAAPQGLGDLQIPASRIPTWSAGVDGGIPDTSDANIWPVFCDVTDPPYNAIPNDGLLDKNAMQSALNDAAAAGGNQVVYVPAGIFRGFGLQNPLKVPSNVVLRGAGRNTTTITGDAGGGPKTWGGVKFYGNEPDQAVSITNSSLPRGTTQITVADVSGFSVGDFCRMEQDNDLSYIHVDPARLSDEYMFHNFKIIAKNGNTLTMDKPLRHYFGTSFSPRVQKMNPVINAGVENMKVMTDELTLAQWQGGMKKPTGPFGIYWAVNCWIDNVFAYNGHVYHLKAQYSTRLTIRNCKFYRLMWAEYGRPETGEEKPYNNYSIVITSGCTDFLVENNIFDDLHVDVGILNGPSGCVIAYNYCVGPRGTHGMFSHGRYPHENLFEGNETTSSITVDNYWGEQGPRITFFRNRLVDTGWFKNEDYHSSTYHPTGFVADQLNVIGNIAWSYRAQPFCKYENGNCRDYDTKTTNLWLERNIYRDTRAGNYGLILNTPEPTTTNLNSYGGDKAPASWSTFNMPASLYLTEKPAWWPAGKPWPCTGSDVDDFTGTLTKLPAQDRYESEQ